MVSEQEWISTAEAAKRLGVSKPTILRYAERGKLRARRLTVGNQVEIYAPDLEALKEPQPYEPKRENDDGGE